MTFCVVRYIRFKIQNTIMRQVKEELKSWNDTLRPENLPREPTDFSYWVAGNLPLDDGLKLHLMTIDSAEQRLRCELSIMKRVMVFTSYLLNFI